MPDCQVDTAKLAKLYEVLRGSTSRTGLRVHDSIRLKAQVGQICSHLHSTCMVKTRGGGTTHDFIAIIRGGPTHR